jgi:hypothetical protein
MEQYYPRETHIIAAMPPYIRADSPILRRNTMPKACCVHLPYTAPVEYADTPATMTGPA